MFFTHPIILKYFSDKLVCEGKISPFHCYKSLDFDNVVVFYFEYQQKCDGIAYIMLIHNVHNVC